MRRLLLVLALIAGFVLPAFAQEPVRNPTRVEFTCPDHAQDTEHELRIVRIEGTNRVLVTTLLLGDPAEEPDGIVRASINVQPIAFGDYVATVSAVAGTFKSEPSEDSNAWLRTPGRPSKVVIR